MEIKILFGCIMVISVVIVGVIADTDTVHLNTNGSSDITDTGLELWEETTVLTISVKTCVGALLLLMKDGYSISRIIIGGWDNSKSGISLCSPSPCQELQIVDTPQTLSCSVSRPFWLIWDSKNRFIRVGRGHDWTSGQFLAHSTSNTEQPTYIGILTPDVTGTWLLTC